MRTRSIAAVLVALAALSAAGPAAAQPNESRLAETVASNIRGYNNFTIFDDVDIAVQGRTVTLTGRVTMPFKRDDIGSRVARIDGVESVVNRIQVLPASDFDAILRRRIAMAIYGHPAFWQYASMVNPPIHIVVEHARVRLTGRVASEVDRMLACALAQVDGALSITNELSIDKN